MVSKIYGKPFIKYDNILRKIPFMPNFRVEDGYPVTEEEVDIPMPLLSTSRNSRNGRNSQNSKSSRNGRKPRRYNSYRAIASPSPNYARAHSFSPSVQNTPRSPWV